MKLIVMLMSNDSSHENMTSKGVKEKQGYKGHWMLKKK